MLAQEFTFEDALKAREEDGREDGIEGTIEVMIKMYNLSVGPEDIKKIMDTVIKEKR
jgi:hypothetical protein